MLTVQTVHLHTQVNVGPNRATSESLLNHMWPRLVKRRMDCVCSSDSVLINLHVKYIYSLLLDDIELNSSHH